VITWQRGGTAVVVAADDDRVTVRSTVPGAPGQTMVGALETGETVKVKVAQVKRDEDGSFAIGGRLVDASRVLRDRVRAMLAS